MRYLRGTRGDDTWLSCCLSADTGVLLTGQSEGMAGHAMGGGVAPHALEVSQRGRSGMGLAVG